MNSNIICIFCMYSRLFRFIYVSWYKYIIICGGVFAFNQVKNRQLVSFVSNKLEIISKRGKIDSHSRAPEYKCLKVWSFVMFDSNSKNNYKTKETIHELASIPYEPLVFVNFCFKARKCRQSKTRSRDYYWR